MFFQKILESLPLNVKGLPKFKAFCLQKFINSKYGIAKFPKKLKLEVDLDNITEVPLWFGIYPKLVHYFLKYNIRPNSSFIDCGSNLGIWSLLALDFKPSENRTIISFEPNPNLYNRLIDTRKLNKIEINNWEISNYALSQDNQEKIIYIDSDVHQLSTLNPIKKLDFNKSIKIKCTRLDDFNINNRVSGIKIDVEGHESDVLLGGLRRLSTDKPWLIIEFNSSYAGCSDINDWKVLPILRELGYNSYKTFQNNDSQHDVQDILFVHKDKAENILFK